MKSGKISPKGNGARAKNTRGKKSGLISKKDIDETTPPVSKKEDDGLQAMHSKIQKKMSDESAPEMQSQTEDEGTMQTKASDDDVMKADDEMK